ncbi:MAG: homocysteine S-methyltransferase family protein [Chloroflexi bacterium]|nr:homocysteine S-methyltransferase family protein [Chloroflexota bacterium]
MNLHTFLMHPTMEQKTILLDGAMGTQLAHYGLDMGGKNNLTHPEAVLEIHTQYAECGCHLLITNTFSMNHIYIESHHINADVREVNLAGVHLARQAAKEHQYVLGDMSSTGKLLEPYGDLPEAEAYATFQEQAAILAEAGVDGIIVETMYDLREALCALRACKAVTALPVIVSLTFSTTKNYGRTIMGDSAQQCAAALTEAGASVIGTNCGQIDAFQTAEIVSYLKQGTHLPIIAQPNAGKPRQEGDCTHFDTSPDQFVAGIGACIQSGAQLVGGCCGTTPAHIQAVARAFLF